MLRVSVDLLCGVVVFGVKGDNFGQLVLSDCKVTLRCTPALPCPALPCPSLHCTAIYCNPMYSSCCIILKCVGLTLSPGLHCVSIGGAQTRVEAESQSGAWKLRTSVRDMELIDLKAASP